MSFERPNYFAGHLLTDSDLLLEQSYFREKRKLYHRALDGHGVVCGLRLTCDPHRAGGILVDRGYAIDECGNDLFLPERKPFDVIHALTQKHLIGQNPAPDPGEPRRAESEYGFQQSFYITITYHEKEVEFASPLVANSQSTPSDCEPTRILESVTLDVVDKLPGVQDKHHALKHRVEKCFKLFSEGAFAQALQTHQKALSEIINPPAEARNYLEHHPHYHKLFVELRGLLLLYLNKHPDLYNRKIESDIRKVRFPEIHRHSERAQEDYLEDLRDSFSLLLGFAWQHAVSGALGEFLPICAHLSKPSAVSLGTVTVENGRVVRVCNCPRSYVWSAANFREVLLATTLGELACRKEHEEDYDSDGKDSNVKSIGCRDFEFDLECFLQWLKVNPKAPLYAGTELLRWLDALRKSIKEGFDFTNPCHFSTKILEGLDEKKAIEILKAADIQSRTTEAPLETRAPDPFDLMETAGLATGEQPILLAVKDSHITRATLEDSELLTHINYLYSQISTLKGHVERLQAQRP